MAATNTDIRISTAWVNSFKRRKLKRLLGAEGVLAVMDLWIHCGTTHTTGTMSGMTDEDIEVAAGWEGAPGEFVPALIDCRLLDGDEKERSIHDWAAHQEWASKAEARSEASRSAGVASGVARRLKASAKTNGRSTIAERPLNGTRTMVQRKPNDG